MVLSSARSPLNERELARTFGRAGTDLVKVPACGVCRTDLHVVDGELPNPKLPLVPGHEIVGTVAKLGERVERFKPGDRVGVPWLGLTCGKCPYCISGRENLCDFARFTGYTLDGGYADFMLADERYCFPIPAGYSDAEAAPLLCAGLIGYRSLVMAGDGAAAGNLRLRRCGPHHRPGRPTSRAERCSPSRGRATRRLSDLPRELGAVWAGDSTTPPPEELDAAIIFAPVGSLVPQALESLAKGGVVVCAGIHMSDIPAFPYRLLWGERTVRSVANLTRRDAEEFLAIAPQVPVRTSAADVPTRPKRTKPSAGLRSGEIQGAAVLVTASIRYSARFVRKMSALPTAAGEALQPSSRVLAASSSYIAGRL